MAQHVNSLPLELLCAIFCCLSVSDLALVGRVCSKWHRVRQIAACKVRKLTLVIGGTVSEDYPEYPDFTIGYRDGRLLNSDGTVMYPRIVYPTWSFVHLKWLDLNALIHLTVILPNVSTLQVAFHMNSMYQLCAVTILLRLWQTKLVSFKLHPVLDSPRQYISRLHRQIPTQISGPLIEAINSLPALKHLSLLFTNSHFGEAQIDLSILAQLNRFDFRSEDRTDVLLESIRDYAVNNRRLRIRLEESTRIWYPEDLHQYYQIGPQVELIDNQIHIAQLTVLERFCAHFTSLTSLHFDMRHGLNLVEMPLRSLFSHLSRLTQLLRLGLCISFAEIEEEKENPIALASLPSVRSLRLYVHTRSHTNLALLNIPRTMPNLQIIYVLVRGPVVPLYSLSYRCARCGIHGGLVGEQLRTCQSQLMLPLANCTRLHSIAFIIHFEMIRLNSLTLQDLSRPLIFE